MIAVPFEATSDIRLYGPADLPWIEDLVSIVERSVGEPWRVLVERIEQAPLSARGRVVSQRARAAIANALRRLLGGRSERARIARRLRACVLGHPALDRDTRDARLAAAAAELGIEPGDIESLLWADLARERPVVLTSGRPDARRLAAIANLDKLQRELRRAHEIELRIFEQPHAFVRLAARFGLLTHVTRETEGLCLRITGPLALFHATTVYGRALGALVPLLVGHSRFALDLRCELPSGPVTLHVEPPLWLPPYRARPKPSVAEHLARALERRGHAVTREPTPLAIGAHVVFPDLAVEHAGARWFVEVIGFSTTEYLADKRARYAAVGAEVVLCTDASRSPADEHPRVLPFERRIDADALVEIFEGAA
ncbi:MAG TPA: DUF790 family protein [Kofleriaceae bacterium]|nr:DUF790 family protein [Kofleriaceae bacterium]